MEKRQVDDLKKREAVKKKIESPPKKGDDSKKDQKPNVKGQSSIPPMFRPQNPIQTCIGPVGEFIASPEYFPNHPSMAVFGKRRTGKTFFLRWLMYHAFRDIPFGMIFFKFFCHFLSLTKSFQALS
jgi:hypothetical protein